MGYDIYAYDIEPTYNNEGEQNNNPKEITYLRAYMGAFRMCTEQGYDWFELIDAIECDGGVSGNGNGKFISLSNLENALRILEIHDPRGKLADNNGEPRDEWTHRKPQLKDFMEKCVKWCKKNKREAIYVEFG